MQRQKTIAKWLAVILLLTVAVACYFVISTAMKDGGKITDATDKNPPDDDIHEPVVKTEYSSFPREAETVDGITFAHVGGSESDTPLKSVLYLNRRFIVFQSVSRDMDVKEEGLHIAVFNGKTLLSTFKVADLSEEFVSANLTANGVLIITKTADKSKLRLYDSDAKLRAENECEAYSSYLYSAPSKTLYVSDNDFLYAVTVSPSLKTERSNFVYPIKHATLKTLVSSSSSEALVVQNLSGVCFFTFSHNLGFRLNNELINCEFEQILSSSSNGSQLFEILAGKENGKSVYCLDNNFKTLYRAENIEENSLAMTKSGDNILLISPSKIYIYCNHLDLQKTEDIKIDDGMADVFTAGVNVSYLQDDFFLLSSGDKNVIARFSEGVFSPVMRGVSKSPIIIKEFNGKYSYSVITALDDKNPLYQRGFGKSDVFFATLSNYAS